MTLAHYTNLDRVKEYMSLASGDSSDDDKLLSLIELSSRAIDRHTRRSFYPTSDTRYYDLTHNKLVLLDNELMDLTSLRHMNGACTVGSGVMWLATGNNWNKPPYERIILDDSSGSVLNFSGTKQRAIEVQGVWGYHEDWNNAWTDIGTSLISGIDATSKTIILAGAGSVGTDASDIDLKSPRLSLGDLIKVEDSDGSLEWMQVMGSSGSGTDTPIVVRAQNGTSAQSHSSGASIYRFSYEHDVEWATRRLAVWVYAQGQVPYQNRTVNVFTGELEVPDSWPTDVRDRLQRLIRRDVFSI